MLMPGRQLGKRFVRLMTPCCAIQGLAGENNVSPHIFGFIERVIRSFQGAIDIGIYERRHADTNGDIGRDAFI